MAETLVERLREAANEIAIEGAAGWGNTCADAAARIEELERQLADAEKQARIFYAQGEERGRIIEETRRQLAEALRALNIICRMDAENFPTAYARCVDTAAAAIRALEGQT